MAIASWVMDVGCWKFEVATLRFAASGVTSSSENDVKRLSVEEKEELSDNVLRICCCLSPFRCSLSVVSKVDTDVGVLGGEDDRADSLFLDKIRLR